jgi:serine/threonine protein kinase
VACAPSNQIAPPRTPPTAGVIHRDLKPANILLDEDHNAYLADFGIAKNLGDPDLEGQTLAGTMIGSPAYASPEQIRSEAVRPQSDIYCLGVLLFEMLSGQTPFVGPTPIDYIMQHLNQPLPRLNPLFPDLPLALDAALQRATAKEPARRHPDVPALLADVHAAFGDSLAIETAPGLLEAAEVGEIHNPYKGLRPFSEADADDFFGRQTLIRDLLGRLGERTTLSASWPSSASGSNRSPVKAVIPALRRGGLPGSEDWFALSTALTPTKA